MANPEQQIQIELDPVTAKLLEAQKLLELEDDTYKNQLTELAIRTALLWRRSDLLDKRPQINPLPKES